MNAADLATFKTHSYGDGWGGHFPVGFAQYLVDMKRMADDPFPVPNQNPGGSTPTPPPVPAYLIRPAG